MNSDLLSFVVILAVGAPILCLDISGSKERTCVPTSAVPIDLKWAEKQDFYFPMMSRYYLYKHVAQLLIPQDPAKIIEGSVYYDACLRDQIRMGQCRISGYMGTKYTDYFNQPAPNTNGGVAFRPMQGSGFNGTFWFSLTDNSTFLLVSLCDGDNQMMWKLISTTPTLPQSILTQILDYVVNGLGFSKKYFTEMEYETCILHPGQTGWSSVG